jgi:hypothetical protein
MPACPVAAIRLEAGGLREELSIDGVGPVSVRYERCPAGWSARFTLRDPAVPDLAVVHRLVAATLRDARRTVPAAAAFLCGVPTAASVARLGHQARTPLPGLPLPPLPVPDGPPAAP